MAPMDQVLCVILETKQPLSLCAKHDSLPAAPSLTYTRPLALDHRCRHSFAPTCPTSFGVSPFRPFAMALTVAQIVSFNISNFSVRPQLQFSFDAPNGQADIVPFDVRNELVESYLVSARGGHEAQTMRDLASVHDRHM